MNINFDNKYGYLGLIYESYVIEFMNGSAEFCADILAKKKIGKYDRANLEYNIDIMKAFNVFNEWYDILSGLLAEKGILLRKDFMEVLK